MEWWVGRYRELRPMPAIRPFQVVKVREQAQKAKTSQPSWVVDQKPEEALRAGDSIYIQLMGNVGKRRHEEAFTIVSFPEAGAKQKDVRVYLMSSAGIHMLVSLSIPKEWAENHRKPGKVEAAMRVLTGCWRKESGGEE